MRLCILGVAGRAAMVWGRRRLLLRGRAGQVRCDWPVPEWLVGAPVTTCWLLPRGAIWGGTPVL